MSLFSLDSHGLGLSFCSPWMQGMVWHSGGLILWRTLREFLFFLVPYYNQRQIASYLAREKHWIMGYPLCEITCMLSMQMLNNYLPVVILCKEMEVTLCTMKRSWDLVIGSTLSSQYGSPCKELLLSGNWLGDTDFLCDQETPSA